MFADMESLHVLYPRSYIIRDEYVMQGCSFALYLIDCVSPY